MPEGECWASSTNLGREVRVPSHHKPRALSWEGPELPPILHFAWLTIQSESVAKHPIQRPLWGLEHSWEGGGEERRRSRHRRCPGRRENRVCGGQALTSCL